MQIHEVNMDWVSKEAERIEQEKKSRGGDLPDLNWYHLSEGETVLRLMPAFNSSGIPFRKLMEHWELPPEKKRMYCTIGTWPEKTDTCYVCDALDKVLAEFPDKKLGRQRPSSKYLVNVVVRSDPKDGEEAEKKGVRILDLTEGVYNWLILQLKNPKIGPYIFNHEQGVDITITKQKSKGKGGRSRTEYKPGILPGFGPIHEDDEVAAEWLTSLPDLTKIIKYPSDEKLHEMHSYASKMHACYMRKFREASTAGSESEDLYDDDRLADEEYVGPDDSAPPKREVKSKPTASKKSEPPKREVKSEPAPVKKSTAEVETKPPEVKVTESTTSPMQEESPMSDFPACFAGLESPEPHENGSVGFDEELEKCMLCQHELRCMDSKESKGL